ncbi:uncharacterized protein ACN2A1_002390 [Glossina fuscipes fuscipes]
MITTAIGLGKQGTYTEVSNYLRDILPPKPPPNRTRRPTPDIPPHNRRQLRRQQYAATQKNWSKHQGRCISTIFNGRNEAVIPPESIMVPFWKAHAISPEEVEKCRLSETTSPGLDGITSKQLRAVPADILARILSLILWCKRIPEYLQISKTIFIPKKNDAKEPSEFRPITIPSVVIRQLHTILAKRIGSILQHDQRQRAFQPTDGTGDNAIILDIIIRHAKKKHQSCYMASLDVSRAFDSVSHNTILAALQSTGFGEEFIEYLKEYYKSSSTVFVDDAWMSAPIIPKRGVKQAKPGFSLPTILSKATELTHGLFEIESKRNSLGLRSLIMLLMPSPLAYVNEHDFDYCQRYLDFLYRTKPDINFIYYSGGVLVRFKSYVKDPRTDLFLLDSERDVEVSSLPVVQRIKNEPRRITSPCSMHFNGSRHHQQQVKQYLPLGFVNFYKIAANNFFTPGYMRYIKIKALSRTAFVICTSRRNSWPYRNTISSSPSTEQECLQISNNVFSYDLTDLCLSYQIKHECPPLFLSVQAQAFADSSQIMCEEEECLSLQQTQFLLITNNLDCSNQGQQLLKSIELILVITFLNIKNLYK